MLHRHWYFYSLFLTWLFRGIRKSRSVSFWIDHGELEALFLPLNHLPSLFFFKKSLVLQYYQHSSNVALKLIFRWLCRQRWNKLWILNHCRTCSLIDISDKELYLMTCNLSEAPKGLYIYSDLKAVLKLKCLFQNVGTLFEFFTNVITLWTTRTFDIPLLISSLKKGVSSVIFVGIDFWSKQLVANSFMTGLPVQKKPVFFFVKSIKNGRFHLISPIKRLQIGAAISKENTIDLSCKLQSWQKLIGN